MEKNYSKLNGNIHEFRNIFRANFQVRFLTITGVFSALYNVGEFAMIFIQKSHGKIGWITYYLVFEYDESETLIWNP